MVLINLIEWNLFFQSMVYLYPEQDFRQKTILEWLHKALEQTVDPISEPDSPSTIAFPLCILPRSYPSGFLVANEWKPRHPGYNFLKMMDEESSRRRTDTYEELEESLDPFGTYLQAPKLLPPTWAVCHFRFSIQMLSRKRMRMKCGGNCWNCATRGCSTRRTSVPNLRHLCIMNTLSCRLSGRWYTACVALFPEMLCLLGLCCVLHCHLFSQSMSTQDIAPIFGDDVVCCGYITSVSFHSEHLKPFYFSADVFFSVSHVESLLQHFLAAGRNII